MSSMYEIIMSLPLFNGVGPEKISKIVERTKFHFLKFEQGQTIVNANDPCTHIKFIINGSAKSILEDTKAGFTITQTLKAPNVIAPDFLFGLTTTYPCTVTALESTGVLQISKSDYMTILSTDRIFMFNYLNMLSGNAQKSYAGAIAISGNSLEQQIAFKLLALTQSQGSDMTLTCNDMASLFGATPEQLEATLKKLKERNIIDYTPTEISIISRNELIKIIS